MVVGCSPSCSEEISALLLGISLEPRIQSHYFEEASVLPEKKTLCLHRAVPVSGVRDMPGNKPIPTYKQKSTKIEFRSNKHHTRTRN